MDEKMHGPEMEMRRAPLATLHKRVREATSLRFRRRLFTIFVLIFQIHGGRGATEERGYLQTQEASHS